MMCSLVGVVGLVFAATAAAQTGGFPNKPIRVVVPAAPGGSIDTVMRVIAPRMSETISQSVVPETRSGASANLICRACGGRQLHAAGKYAAAGGQCVAIFQTRL